MKPYEYNGFWIQLDHRGRWVGTRIGGVIGLSSLYAGSEEMLKVMIDARRGPAP